MTKTAPKRTPTRITYKPFYLIMLILSTISIAMSVWGVAELPNLISHFSAAPFYVALTLFSLAVLPLSISALILLYQKNKLGLTLMFVSFAINFIIGIVMLFITEQAYQFTLATSAPESEASVLEGINANQLFSFFWYAAISIGNVSIIVAATLWHFAWRNQHKSAKK